MATISPNPAIQDLKVTFQESTLVFPPNKTDQNTLFLSNIDQILNYNIPTASFFPANKDYPPQVASQRLKSALQKVLVPYDFMAGRLKLNDEMGRLGIHCNAAGAGFVVAASEFSLDEIGDLVCPNLGFRQLAIQTLPDVDDQPLFILQITSFKCGGFAIGMSVNHILLDGLSAKAFTENLASQAFDDDKPLATIPCLDRRLLAARSPPRVSSPHPASGPPVFDCKKEELDFKVFKLSPSDIGFLKDKAKTEASARISSFNVVASLVWRCKALSYEPDNKERVSTLLNVIDLRSRLDPPLLSSYCGNALLVAYASAKCGDIEKLPFGEVVKMVSEGPGRVTDEYARSVIDWLEINRGLPCGEYMVSSWLRLGFEQVVYPWGKPVHSGPVVNHRKDICWIFPTADGVNALVSLPAEEMKRFESEFRKCFTCGASCVLDPTIGMVVAMEDDVKKEISSFA
ncbi:omega-hydroxypalmitate o-feruloyl transferase [Phtheirospermum japonicum]|uniref:Omega-hydroxypalmitate o-feruloyl transferase n=1 Tax=Phtheirospermum japonicum TaxID=374723 RepID=A0A830D3T5_9LAMI|nr:omega-hydroxypalmitate o-feruloyl transferase [Phtheirospermum japonicum]